MSTPEVQAAELMARVFLVSPDVAATWVFGESADWDSLKHAELLMEIEDYLDRQLSDEEAWSIIDHASIVACIRG